MVLKEDQGVLALAYTNSHFQTGLKNVLDRAVLSHTETHQHANIPNYQKVDEIPFDFERRIMSVVVRTPEGKDRIISKGAPEAIFPRCATFELDGEHFPMDPLILRDLSQEFEELSKDGFRVLAIASKDVDARNDVGNHVTHYSKTDESNLVLNGYIAFLDPPKDSATEAIKALYGHGVVVKVVTGDNDLVARKICNDAPALRTADVGISVDTAVDIAKESADMILLEKSLMVLESGVSKVARYLLIFANMYGWAQAAISGICLACLGQAFLSRFYRWRRYKFLPTTCYTTSARLRFQPTTWMPNKSRNLNPGILNSSPDSSFSSGHVPRFSTTPHF